MESRFSFTVRVPLQEQHGQQRHGKTSAESGQDYLFRVRNSEGVHPK